MPIEHACARIAPTWPLDRFIAVNPFWGLVGTPLPEVAATLRALSGAQLLMPRAWYRDAYRAGQLRDDHLAAALAAAGDVSQSVASLRALLDQPEPTVATRARVVDVVDAGRDLIHAPSWRSFITSSVSQFCAAFFDDGQATLGPSRDGGLYASWRRFAITDRSPALLVGADAYRAHAKALPATARDVFATALAELAVPPGERERYLWSLLLDQNGWASWCAYRRWTAQLERRDDDAIVELLAIRIAWEWLLHRMGGDAIARRWAAAMASWAQVDAAASAARPYDWLLQAAMEIAWREPLVRALPAGLRVARPAQPSVQAAFCIDVRSEVMRRALETAAPSVQTLGCAGFFGLPMVYRPPGAAAGRPQLPGLVAPRLDVTDTGHEPAAIERRARDRELASGWRAFRTDPLSTFTFVEALGVTYAAKLLHSSFTASPRAREASARPRIAGTLAGAPLDLDARCELAAAMLRGMSLTRRFARVVLLVGHGSTTRNNPHASGLDCGACGGHSGEVNARVGAALLNDPEVRAGLRRRGIDVPDTTWFVGALHDTTTDDVTLFELDALPADHAGDVAAVRVALDEARARARAERAARLGLAGASGPALDRAIERRAVDWSQVRPEWGLAGNAAFIVAPREHCRHLDLQGRTFLHDYRHDEDEGDTVLELIMTAPMVVIHWINFQYYASTVDPVRYGSGNKILHNVVGGHLGVFEGNGGDLRIGLPLQSVHDGTGWVHAPLRLSVFIEAPRPSIDAILEKHATVRDLVANGWLSLFQLDPDQAAVYARRGASWVREPA